MKLSKDEVKKVAKLANLPITEEQDELYSEQLSKVLDYIDQLNEVQTDAVEPTFNVSGLSNVWSEDEVEPSLPQEDVLKNAPNTAKGYFVTKGVFEEE